MFIEINYIQYYDNGDIDIIKTVINTNHIVCINKYSAGADLKMINGDSFFLKETYEEIKQKLQL